MLKNNEDLPVRFWEKKEQPETFIDKRVFIKMKSSEFRKIYNKIINPFLRKLGFKTAGFKALKEDETFYYLALFETDKFGDVGYFTLSIHPKGLPTKWHSKWEENHTKQVHQYIFKKLVHLPNGNKEFDLGINVAEAEETCAFLLKAIENQYDSLIEPFSNYPKKTVSNYFQ